MKTKLLLFVTLLVVGSALAQIPPPAPGFPVRGFPSITNTVAGPSNSTPPPPSFPGRFAAPSTAAPVATPSAETIRQPVFLPPPPAPAEPIIVPPAPVPTVPAVPFTAPPTIPRIPPASSAVPTNLPTFPPPAPLPTAPAVPPAPTLAPPTFPAFPSDPIAPPAPAPVPTATAPSPTAPPMTVVPPAPNRAFQPLQTVTPNTLPPPAPRTAPMVPPGFPAFPVPAPLGKTNPIVIAPPVPTPTLPGFPPANAVLEPEKAQDIVTIKFQEVPLAEVLDTYAEYLGKTILRAPNLALTTPITLKVQGEITLKEAIEALDTVLALNGVTMVPMGTKFMKAVPFAQAQQEAAAFSTVTNSADLPEAARYMTRILQLKHAKPSEIVPAIQGFAKLPNSILPIDTTQILILRDYAENVKRMLEVIEKIDTAIPIDEDFEVIPIKYALSSDMAAVLGSLTGGGGAGGATTRTPGGSTRRTSLPGAVGSTVGGAGSLGGQQGMGMGMGGQPGQPGYNPQAGTTTPGASANTLQQRLQQIVSRAATGTGSGNQPYLGEARIMPYERGNSLLVLANKADMLKVKDVIAKLDVVQQQVLIEAIIVDVNLSDDFSLGVAVGQNRVNKGGLAGVGSANNDGALNTGSQLLNKLGVGTNVVPAFANSPGGLSYFGRLGPVFDVAVTALASDSRVNILSRPRIQATHAEQATLFIGETVPYVTGTYFGGVGTGASSQYQQLAVGISLNVLPLINPDGLVILEIAQNIEQIGGFVKIDANEVPTTTRRQAQTKVAVRDGDVIILGGFITSTKTRTKSGVPFLKDIPVLGALFRSQKDGNKRSELMVLIRPTVLRTPESAAQFSTGERNNLPGVRQAEYEFMKDELARRKKLDDFRKRTPDFETPLIPSGPSSQSPTQELR